MFNKSQRRILLIGITLVAWSFLFPCWVYQYKDESPVQDRVEYQFIFSPPTFGGPTAANKVIGKGELKKGADAQARLARAAEAAYAEALKRSGTADEGPFDFYYANLQREAKKYQVPSFENGLFTGEFYDSRLGVPQGQPNSIGKPMKIDFTRMLIQIGIIVLVGGGLVMVFKDDSRT